MYPLHVITVCVEITYVCVCTEGGRKENEQYRQKERGQKGGGK